MRQHLARFAFALLALLPAASLAAQYEREIDVEGELELYDLAAQGEISDETLQTLLELASAKVDLNSANREQLYALPNVTYAHVDALLAYRSQTGSIRDMAELVAAGVFPERLGSQLLPFTVLRAPGQPLPLAGRARLMVTYAPPDGIPPPGKLELNATGPWSLRGGAALVTQRLGLSDVRGDALREGLSARAAGYEAVLPKVWLGWRGSKVEVLAGTFTVGFGQRLTLDTTVRATPDGIYPDDVVTWDRELVTGCRLSQGELPDPACDEALRNTSVLSDFRWREGLRGLAARLTDVPLGSANLALTAFGSYQSKSIYQYAVYDRNRCQDPRSEDSDCNSPTIYRRPDVAGEPAPAFAYSRISHAYDELSAGGNARIHFSPTTSLGVTGYSASPRWKIPDASLDFQEWATTPFGGNFGAVGVDGAFASGAVSLFAEVTRSFDSIPGGGGGFGAIQRTALELAAHQELELGLRYYDRNFANGFGGAYAAADRFQGQRARNEAGARLRYLGKPDKTWSVRGDVDFWLWPSDGDAAGTAGTSNLEVYGRTDYLGFSAVKLALFGDLRNRDLARSKRGACYEVATEFDDEGEVLPCQGELYRVGARATFMPLAPLATFALQYQHTWLDDPRYKTQFRQDVVSWAEVTVRPSEALRIQARARYRSEAVDDPTYLEETLWSWLEVSANVTTHLKIGARVDLVAYLDKRESTPLRKPSPEYRGLLDVEARF